jgi:imidazolonepropionase-like amidohydrolase
MMASTAEREGGMRERGERLAIRAGRLVDVEAGEVRDGPVLLVEEDRVGSLAPGRYADLIAVPGDPLDDLGLLAEVPFVMQGGRVLKSPPEMRLPTAPI